MYKGINYALKLMTSYFETKQDLYRLNKMGIDSTFFNCINFDVN